MIALVSGLLAAFAVGWFFGVAWASPPSTPPRAWSPDED